MNNSDGSRESLSILRADTSGCATAVPVYDLFRNLSSFDCAVTTILRPPLTPSVSRSLVLCSSSFNLIKWKERIRQIEHFLYKLNDIQWISNYLLLWGWGKGHSRIWVDAEVNCIFFPCWHCVPGEILRIEYKDVTFFRKKCHIFELWIILYRPPRANHLMN